MARTTKGEAATAAAPAKKAPAKKAAAATATTSKAASTTAAGSKAAAPSKAAPRKAAAKPAPKEAPGRTPVQDKFFEAQRLALLEERESYTRQAKSLRDEADQLALDRDPGDVQFDEESGQGDSMNVERERDLALSAQALVAVSEIDVALEKIDLGTYGICDKCSTTIPRERLRALPHAALCVQCKSGGLSRR